MERNLEQDITLSEGVDYMKKQFREQIKKHKE